MEDSDHILMQEKLLTFHLDMKNVILHIVCNHPVATIRLFT